LTARDEGVEERDVCRCIESGAVSKGCIRWVKKWAVGGSEEEMSTQGVCMWQCLQGIVDGV